MLQEKINFFSRNTTVVINCMPKYEVLWTGKVADYKQQVDETIYFPVYAKATREDRVVIFVAKRTKEN